MINKRKLLLATTTLAAMGAGSAHAAMGLLAADPTDAATLGASTAISTTAVYKVASEVWTSSSAAFTTGRMDIDLGANLAEDFYLTVELGGNAATFSAVGAVSVLTMDANNTLADAATASLCTGSALGTTLKIDCNMDAGTNYRVLGVAGIGFSGVAKGTVNATIVGKTTSGNIQFGTATDPYLSAESVVTFTDSTSTLTTPSLSTSASPVFSDFDGSGGVSAAIAKYTLSLNDPKGLALGTAVPTTDLSATVVVTHPILALSGVTNVSLSTNGANINGTESTTAGTSTFAIGGAAMANHDDDATTISLLLDGTTTFTAQNAGSLTITFGAGTTTTVLGSTTLPSAVSGTTTGIALSGVSQSFSHLLPSGSTFTSYLRVRNTGSVAGDISITLKKQDGTSLGTYNAGSLAAGAATHVSIPTVETALAVSAANKGLYQATVTGAFTGTVQHIEWNGGDMLSNLSARQ